MRKLKKYCFICIICIAFASSCDYQNSDNFDDKITFAFTDELGHTREECFSNLKISDEQVIKTDNIGKYDLVSNVTFENFEFSQYFLFTTNDILYGGGYMCQAENNDKEFGEFIQKLKSALTNKYGQPTTYPGLQYIIGDISDFSKYDNRGVMFVERWNDGGNTQIELNIDFEENPVIKIEYKIIQYPK